jgi:hypothetical protein
MSRREDPPRVSRHWKYTRYVKTTIGGLFGLATIAALFLTDVNTTLGVVLIAILANISGVMLDSPTATKVASFLTHLIKDTETNNADTQ